MDCYKVTVLMCSYLDDMLDQEERVSFEEHIKNCTSCNDELIYMQNIISGVKELPEIPLPENFHIETMLKLKNEISPKRNYYFHQYWYVVASFLVLFVVATAFHQMSVNEQPLQYTAAPEAPQGKIAMKNPATLKVDISEVDENVVAQTAQQDSRSRRGYGVEQAPLKSYIQKDADLQKKIIKNYSISIETENFDETINKINNSNLLTESSQTYYTNKKRTSMIMKKVPVGDYESTLTYFASLGNVVSQYEKTDDVTYAYLDTQNAVNALVIERDRLTALLEKVTDVKQLLLLDEKLNSLTSNIEAYNSQLESYNTNSNFSTININIIDMKAVYHHEGK